MKNFKKFNTIALAILMSLIFACSQEEEIAPLDITDQVSSRMSPNNGLNPGNVVLCDNSTNVIWADMPYQNSVSMNIIDTKTFHTNEVCGATKYYWTVDDQATMTTTTPSVSLQGSYLIWLPPGGCKDFNKKWTSSNPFFNKENPCAWGGQLPTGTYASKLSVRAENSSTSVDIPVYVSGVEFCVDSSTCKGSSGGGIGGGGLGG